MNTNATVASPTNNSNTSTRMQQTCRLLTLPPELRDDITEMAVNNIPRDRVDLLTAIPPGNGLLCACRQTYQETKCLYEDARHRYWADTKFTIARNVLLTSSRVHFTASNLFIIRHIHFTTSIHELSRLRKYSHNIDFIEEIGSFGHDVRFERRTPGPGSLCDVVWCPIGPDRTSSQIMMSVSRGKYSFGRGFAATFSSEETSDGMMTRDMDTVIDIGQGMKTTQSDNQNSPFLELPPELRNNIYELAFATTAGPVNLFDASPPNKALLVVSIQIRNEAASLFKWRYWRTTTFQCTSSSYSKAMGTSRPLPFREEDLQWIRDMYFFCTTTQLARFQPDFSRNFPRYPSVAGLKFHRQPGGWWICESVDGVAAQQTQGHSRLAMLCLTGSVIMLPDTGVSDVLVAKEQKFDRISKSELVTLLSHELQFEEG
ncbi:hypothetical protein LTR17_002185 [Elasticomyces elasticus]|nr:hypothetical protein LTR17_002185 [Elasticomyces elasticus]